MARRRAGWPLLTAYWFSPARMAAMAAAFTAAGPSKSGNPWPRLMAWCSTARRDMAAKMLVPKVETRSADFIYYLRLESSRTNMRSRRPHFTPTQWVALILLAGGALGTLALLAALVYGSQLVPQPEIVAAIAARITDTAGPPTQTLSVRFAKTLMVSTATQ